jgi:hypothetical protein
VGDVATAGAGATVALVFGDDGGHGRQLGDLMPAWLGVARPGVARQRGLTAAAAARDVADEVVDPFGGQAVTDAGGVIGLAAGRARRDFFLGAGRGTPDRSVEGGREEFREFWLRRASRSWTRLQPGDLLLQGSNHRIAVATALAARHAHVARL